MKKLIWNIFVAILLIIAIIGDIQMANSSKNDDVQIQNNTAVLSQNDGFSVQKGDVWTPTFQLCWKELINLINRDNTIEFINENPSLADELNKQKFDEGDLNSDSYYIKTGKMTLKLKNQIKKDIKSKFNEKSDILDKFEFENTSDSKTDKYFIYSMLIKNFPFKYAFTNITAEPFNNVSNTKYKYFGFSNNPDVKNKQLQNISYLFYSSDDDFALKMQNADKSEEMILYLSDSDKSFDDIYNEIAEKSAQSAEYTKLRIDKIIAQNYEQFNNKDIRVNITPFLKVPYITINEEINYDEELANKPIKGKEFEKNGEYWEILKTLQTVKFNMDNEGAKLKSEAGMAVMKQMAARPSYITLNLNNYYYFDRPFVIFLKETNKDKPYFAAKIKDGKYLVKSDN